MVRGVVIEVVSNDVILLAIPPRPAIISQILRGHLVVIISLGMTSELSWLARLHATTHVQWLLNAEVSSSG